MVKYIKMDTMNVEFIVGAAGCVLALFALIVASMAKGASYGGKKVEVEIRKDMEAQLEDKTGEMRDEYKRQLNSFQEEIKRQKEKVDKYAQEFNEMRGEVSKLVARIADALRQANKHTNAQNAVTTERLDQTLGELRSQLRLVEDALAKLDEDLKPRAIQVINEQLRRRGYE